VLKFDYPEMNLVQRVIKEHNLKIIEQKLELNCEIRLSVRKKIAEEIFQKFESIYKVEIKNLND